MKIWKFNKYLKFKLKLLKANMLYKRMYIRREKLSVASHAHIKGNVCSENWYSKECYKDKFSCQILNICVREKSNGLTNPLSYSFIFYHLEINTLAKGRLKKISKLELGLPSARLIPYKIIFYNNKQQHCELRPALLFNSITLSKSSWNSKGRKTEIKEH